MGVSIEAWRARIGQFCSAIGCKRLSGATHEWTTDALSLMMLAICATIIFILLIIGGVEQHPGPFPCRFCSAVPETIASYVRHQNMHATRSKAFIYSCPADGCQEFATTSYGYMKYHVSNLHRKTYHQDPAATSSIHCPYIVNENHCCFSSVSFWEFVQHLYCHLDNGIRVMCPVRDCRRRKDFQKKSTLQVHMSQEHVNWRAEGCPKEEYKTPVASIPAVEQDSSVPFEESSFPINVDESTSDNFGPGNNDLLNDGMILDSIAKFYLHLYAENLLPAKTIQEICDNLVFLTEIIHARTKLILLSELQNLDIPEHKVNSICNKIMLADLLFTSHHKSCRGPSLTSDHLRRKYFADHFKFEEPVQINLQEKDPDSKDTLQYVSIDKSLTQLLKDNSIKKEIEASFLRTLSTDGEVRDYYDGSLFLSEDHPPKEIQINIYQDSFSPVLNALGSAKNTFKDLVVYFTIGNFRAHLRSKVLTKHLILLCREAVFKKFGAKKCLATMMEELKTLEAEGIIFNGERIPVVFEFMIGDNLGQHMIGGFVESFSGTFMCRFCEISRAEMKSNPSLTLPQRTVDDYKLFILRAKLTGKSFGGLKENCELNCLKHFHATSHLPPCLGHDLFEGVVSRDLAGVIEYFVIVKKWFTYKLLNKRIKKFKCRGIDASNKPALFCKEGKKLGGHAIQNWMMLRLLFFFIGDRIEDFNDPAWILYLKLKEMCEIFCAPSFLKTDVPYLKHVLIPEYFEIRNSIGLSDEKYPIRPKHHFVAHYPELMLKYGPLIYLWTLPFEQKHSFFKGVLRKTHNFINPEYSGAVRYQMNFCLTTSSEMFTDEFLEKKPKPLLASSFTGDLAVYVSQLNFCGLWSDCEQVCVNTTVYKRNGILLLASYGNVISVGIIKIIATKEDTLNFVTEERKATYDEDIGLYEVDFSSLATYNTHSPSDLKYPIPQPLYSWRSRSLFSLKFKLVPSVSNTNEHF